MDVLSSRASLPSFKAGGIDGSVNESWKQLQLTLVAKISTLFNVRAQAKDEGAEPGNWKTIPYFTIMKVAGAQLLSDFRYLGKQVAIQKW